MRRRVGEQAYRIRLARHNDLEKLAAIERQAASLFAATADAFLCDAQTMAIELLEQHHRDRAVWVAVNREDEPVGFAVAGESEGSGYLHEVDVDPLHGRRGLGRRLIETVCEWAVEMGYDSVTLSTFVDVPWNAPFYARAGFEIVAANKLTPEMQRIQGIEERIGLAIDRRVFMKRRLR